MQPDEKSRFVRAMFSDIAPRYDLLNRLLSLSIDRGWRRAAVGRLGWQSRRSGVYLDACAGTLDLALTLADQGGFEGSIVAADFAAPMLHSGKGKVAGRRIHPGVADTLALPARDQSFDGALVGFGLRNLASAEAGVAELARVLKPGARLVVLDLTTPPREPMRSLYLLYFRRILPLVGRVISGHRTAYSYLPSSVMSFQTPGQLEQLFRGAGLRDCGHQLLTGGIAAVVWGTR